MVTFTNLCDGPCSAYPHTHAESYTDCNGYTHTHSDTYCNSYAKGYSYTKAASNSATATGAAVIWVARAFRIPAMASSPLRTFL